VNHFRVTLGASAPFFLNHALQTRLIEHFPPPKNLATVSRQKVDPKKSQAKKETSAKTPRPRYFAPGAWENAPTPNDLTLGQKKDHLTLTQRLGSLHDPKLKFFVK
jgi:hypothetical protein